MYSQKTLDEMDRIGKVEMKRAGESFVEKKVGLEFWLSLEITKENTQNIQITAQSETAYKTNTK